MRRALAMTLWMALATSAPAQEPAGDDLIFPDESYLGLGLREAIDRAVDHGWIYVSADHSDPAMSLALSYKDEASSKPTHMVFAAARGEVVESVMIFTSLPLDLYLTQLTRLWGAPAVRDLDARFDAGFQWAADEGRTLIHLAEATVPDDPNGRTLTAVNLSRPVLYVGRGAR